MNNFECFKLILVLTLVALSPATITSQVVVGTGTPDVSAAFEIQGTDRGFLLPRLTTDQRNAIASPAFGLMILNTSTFCLEINIGTPALPEWSRLQCRTSGITSIDCGGAVVTGNPVAGVAVNNLDFTVPYYGGNGGIFPEQLISSTGVTGLIATLTPGNLAVGDGNLNYTVTGTPASSGTANFALSIGGQSCNQTINVSAPVCRAKIDATTYRNFMCHNLGAANTNADPFTPSWEINGGYWQWGRLSQAAVGPVGPSAGETNEAAVGGWNATNAPNGSWSDASKTVNDPCPAGYRIPTKAQWDAVMANNILTNTGSWTNSSTNYSSGKKIGSELMLPAAGERFGYGSNGALNGRGGFGRYWSSKESSTNYAWFLGLFDGGASTDDDNSNNYLRAYGFSVRCIAEIPGVIGSLDCNGAIISGSLASGYVASGVSASIAYTGGDGESYSGQTVISTGVTGLTATLWSGYFSIGSGNLVYSITGTPTSAGTATFAINIGGQTCNLDIPVSSTPVCRAKIDATTYKNFMCHNLGAANTSADPFTPSWEINGGYWQWGRLAQAAAGPTGPGVSETNEGDVSGWNTSYALNGSWADANKTANDPCPSGYRVPTKSQFDGMVANNTLIDLGTWTGSSTNYSSGKKFGAELMLPAAGSRTSYNGALVGRSYSGAYWSSTENPSNFYVWGLYFLVGYSGSSPNSKSDGFSVRCIAE